MTHTQIEEILRKAPAIKPPVELEKDIRMQITLPRPSENRTSLVVQPFWRRWAPAFSFGIVCSGCVVAFAFQMAQLSDAKEQNRRLQEQASALLQISPETTAAVPSADTARVEAELEQLRAEVERLRAGMAELPILEAQKVNLTARLKEKQAQQNFTDPFLAHKTHADVARCINNIKQIGLALRMWANDHNDTFPPSLASATNELNTPKVLVCPADTNNSPAPSRWAGFNFSSVSYEFLAAGGGEENPNVVLTRCLVHRDHIGLADGSAHQKVPEDRLSRENGILKLVPRR